MLYSWKMKMISHNHHDHMILRKTQPGCCNCWSFFHDCSISNRE